MITRKRVNYKVDTSILPWQLPKSEEVGSLPKSGKCIY